MKDGRCRICRQRHSLAEGCPPAQTRSEQMARAVRRELKPCKAPDLEADKAKVATESET